MNEGPNPHKALRIAAVVAIGVSAVQLVMWLLIWIGNGHLANPWWLWTGYAAAGLIVVERYLSRRPATARDEADFDARETR